MLDKADIEARRAQQVESATALGATISILFTRPRHAHSFPYTEVRSEQLAEYARAYPQITCTRNGSLSVMGRGLPNADQALVIQTLTDEIDFALERYRAMGIPRD